MAMGQNPNRTPSEHPIQSPPNWVLNWVVHLWQIGTIGFEPWPHHVEPVLAQEACSASLVISSHSVTFPGLADKAPITQLAGRSMEGLSRIEATALFSGAARR